MLAQGSLSNLRLFHVQVPCHQRWPTRATDDDTESIDIVGADPSLPQTPLTPGDRLFQEMQVGLSRTFLGFFFFFKETQVGLSEAG